MLAATSCQGNRPHEQAGGLKQYDWGPSPKLRGSGIQWKNKLITTFLALLIIEVRDRQNPYSSNCLPFRRYLESVESRFVLKLVSYLTSLHAFTYYGSFIWYFFRGKLGPKHLCFGAQPKI